MLYKTNQRSINWKVPQLCFQIQKKMTNTTDHFEYMFLPGWPKNVAILFSIVGYLVSAAFFYGVIWFEKYQSDILRTVQVIFTCGTQVL